MEQDPENGGASGLLNLVTFEEACAVFGEAGARTRLRDFREGLARQLSWIGQDQPDHKALRDIAHRTAGQAGVLGLPALAEASARLDEAARHDSGVAYALDHWQKQARLASEIPLDDTETGASDT